MGSWLLIAAGAAWACPDVQTEVQSAEQALLEARYQQAWEALTEAEAGLACSAVDPALLARLWLTEGVLSQLEGRDGESALRAAGRTDPTVWNPNYGPAQRADYDAAQVGRARGRIELLPMYPSHTGALNGEPAEYPVEVEEGLHLVQVLEGSRVELGRIVVVEAGVPLSVSTGLEPPLERPDPVVATLPPAPVEVERERGPGLLIASGGLALLAGGAAAGALSQNRVMNETLELDEFDTAFRRQQLLAYAAYGLAGTAGVGLVVHFAIH